MKSESKLFLKPIVFAHIALFFAVCFSAPLSYGAEGLVLLLERRGNLTASQLEVLGKQGDVNAQYKLGDMYLRGKGVERDLQKSIGWYEAAAKQGHVEAPVNLAAIYHNEEDGIPKDLRKALKWLKAAAREGHPEAQNRIGYMYYHGEEGLRDFQRAFQWFKAAAKQGHVEAQYSVAHAYYHGKGVPRDPKKALKWLKTAAKGGGIKGLNLSLAGCTVEEKGLKEIFGGVVIGLRNQHIKHRM